MQVIQTIMSPVILIILAKAWADAKDGDPADALESGTISSKDQVIAGGRWPTTAGTMVITNFTPQRTVQKVAYVPKDPAGFCRVPQTLVRREEQSSEHGFQTGFHLQAQYLNLRNPAHHSRQNSARLMDNHNDRKNQWVLHPEVDGCAPFVNDGGGLH